MRRIVSVILLALCLTGCSSPSAPTPAYTPYSTPDVPQVLIFGDSYTEGVGAARATDGYAYQVGPAMGWNVTVDGVGGTGYVNDAGGKGTFAERLAVADYGDDFDLVIIEGGTNDQKAPPAQLSAAVDNTLTSFATRFPRAQVIMLGLLSWDDSISQAKTGVNTELRQAADERAYRFIDSLGEMWFTAADRATLINPANNHPNGGGYAVMAQRLVADLKVLQPLAGARTALVHR